MHSLGFPIEDFRFFSLRKWLSLNILKIKAVMMKTAVVAMAFEIFTNV